MEAAASRQAKAADAAWRVAFRLAYRLARVWWFIRRPEQQGAYVAVWVQEELLLIRNSYKPGDTLPCGGIGAGESPAEAARRELREEVGIEASETDLVFAELVEFDNEYKRDHAHIFELHLDARPEVRIDRREVVWAAFVGRSELADRPLVDAVKRYIEGLGP